MNKLIIKYKRLNDDAVAPTKAHDADAGYDLTAISKKETPEYIQYGIGLAFEIPNGYVGLLFPRSSVTKKDMMLKNSVGVIDAPYRGEVSFRFYKIITEEINRTSQIYDPNNGDLIEKIFNVLNHKREPNIYEVGDRIGQIVFMELPQVEFNEVLELSDTERGEGGYGSTDNKKE